jgi:mRNA-decapping enzyme C-terminus
MLSKAQAEFTGGSCGVEQKFADMKMNQLPSNLQQVPPQHPTLMKQLSNAMPDITSPNVFSFFAAAQQPNGVVSGIAENSHVPKMAHGPMFVNHHHQHHHHPIVQPPVQTVDEIEKLHRVPSLSPKIGLHNVLLNDVHIRIFILYLISVLQQQNQQPLSPQPVNVLQQPIAANQQAPKPTLITPIMFQAPINEEKANFVAPPSQFSRPEPLTQNQLLQALNYLLENDPDFIRKIHEAYINSFNKIIST